MSSKPNTTYWYLCVAAAVLLSIITFTPLVIPAGVYEPMLFGIPYTLWVSFLVMVLFVIITYIGTRVHPGRNDKDAD
ncbi:hypothetical protein [Tunicatimonas pelagia]|uniref:hypothetical protein n=1 Tax=Tunicatimonas pelagia TaxID=931531 RepID=UPI00266638BB|nr:hypothetical protein [Tunicatimonas pelagia]WKN45527.1 hypothetical protein P0M28_11220 [Tunicatimonas pelagia]